MYYTAQWYIGLTNLMLQECNVCNPAEFVGKGGAPHLTAEGFHIPYSIGDGGSCTILSSVDSTSLTAHFLCASQNKQGNEPGAYCCAISEDCYSMTVTRSLFRLRSTATPLSSTAISIFLVSLWSFPLASLLPPWTSRNRSFIWALVSQR